MAATATIEELKELETKLMKLQDDNPRAFEDLRMLLSANKQIGYKNICRMILGDPPEKLKGLE